MNQFVHSSRGAPLQAYNKENLKESGYFDGLALEHMNNDEIIELHKKIYKYLKIDIKNRFIQRVKHIYNVETFA